MKRSEIVLSRVYSNGKGTTRQVLNFQKEQGQGFGGACWRGGGLKGDNLKYKILEGRGKGQVNVMTARKFANWAKRRENPCP